MKFLRWIFRKPNTVEATKRQFPRRPPRRIPSQPQPVSNKPIDYVINDMTTPDLVKQVEPPTPPAEPRFIVQKYAGGGFPRGTPENLAANCFVTVANTLNLYKNYAVRPLNRWAAVSTLAVMPVAGVDLNAFYDRRSLQFFYFGHKRIGGTVFTAESSDIVAHELGHALLDAYRPDTWNAAALEVWAYHEAFADWTAITHLMSHEEVLEYAVRQTGGDLRRPNVIANLAEHVGRAIYEFAGPQSGRSPHALRSAINNFKYVSPGGLPEDAPHDQLAAECHSFGRLFLGVFYDLLVGVYELHREQHGPVAALRHARDAVAKRVMLATQNAGVNVKFYESIARTLLWADKTHFDSRYHDLIQRTLIERQVIQPEVKILSAPSCDNDEKIMRTSGKLTLRLSEHIVRSQSIVNNPLYDVELEVPNDQVFLYDQSGQIIDAMAVSDEETIRSAQQMVDYLHIAKKVGDGPDTPFEVRDGKLVRTHFS